MVRVLIDGVEYEPAQTQACAKRYILEPGNMKLGELAEKLAELARKRPHWSVCVFTSKDKQKILIETCGISIWADIQNGGTLE